MTYSTQTTPLRLMKRQRSPMKSNAAAVPAVPKPEVATRSASLPMKLEEAPPTKKLFWFRPSRMIVENREIMLQQATTNGGQASSSTVSSLTSTPADDDASATTYLSMEGTDNLVGLDFIEVE